MKRYLIVVAIFCLGCKNPAQEVDLNTLTTPITLIGKRCEKGCRGSLNCFIVVRDGDGKLVTVEGKTASIIANSVAVGQIIKE